MPQTLTVALFGKTAVDAQKILRGRNLTRNSRIAGAPEAHEPLSDIPVQGPLY